MIGLKHGLRLWSQTKFQTLVSAKDRVTHRTLFSLLDSTPLTSFPGQPE